jgi:hypothetical protein
MEIQFDFFDPPMMDDAQIMLAIQQQIHDLTDVVSRQNDVMRDMAALLDKQKSEISMLMADKYRNDTKITQFDNDIRRIDYENNIKDPYGYSNKRAGQAIEEIYPTVMAFKNSNLTDILFTMMEVFKNHLSQLPENQKAEIVSKMASGESRQTYFSYAPSSMYVDYDTILKEAAKLLDQPESILTLYK